MCHILFPFKLSWAGELHHFKVNNSRKKIYKRKEHNNQLPYRVSKLEKEKNEKKLSSNKPPNLLSSAILTRFRRYYVNYEFRFCTSPNKIKKSLQNIQ